MLLLFTSALLFIFLAYVFGSYFSIIVHRLTRQVEQQSSHLLTFLLGFIFLGAYFNAWSFFWEVDFLSIVTLAIISVFVLRNAAVILQFKCLKKTIFALGQRKMLPVILPVFVLIFLFAIIPPQHGDSGSYHFMSIRWIEEFKVIPGLANLHGRFGFNSSFFVSSAAFSFSKIFDQSLYTINIAVAFVFYLWLINKIYHYRNTLWAIAYLFIVIILFRSLLISVSSPSPDILSSVLVLYLCIDFAERAILKSPLSTTHTIKQLWLVAFALTIKLSAIGLLPLAALLFIEIKWKKHLLMLTTFGTVVILCPWLIRNYILTGYLIYPASFTGIFSPDWKVPFEILNFDRLLINNGPKLISEDWEIADKMPFWKWFPLWIEGNFRTGLAFSLSILGTAVACLLFGIFKTITRKDFKMILIFIAILLGIIFWLINSPDYRFGYAYIIAGIGCVLLYFLKGKKNNQLLYVTSIIILFAASGYYATRAIRHLEGYSIAKYWLKPMPSSVFRLPHKISTYQYRMLNNDTKLYIEDSLHNWNLVPLPAYMDFGPGITADNIELLGSKIEDGFRIKKKL